MRWYFDLILGNDSLREKLASLFELRVPAEELPRAFEEMAAGGVTPIKALVGYGR